MGRPPRLIQATPELEQDLIGLGYAREGGHAALGAPVFAHQGGMFPRIVVVAKSGPEVREAAIKVESRSPIFRGRTTWAWRSWDIRWGPYRHASIPGEATTLGVVERRGYVGVRAVPRCAWPGQGRMAPHSARDALAARDVWKARRRRFDDDAEGFEVTEATLTRVIELAGSPDLACHLIFEVEREYWQARNRAARVQKARQDRLGLGWANHDHHTFRCSRRFFPRVIGIFETLGFQIRERFHAGHHAGWGAQIVDHPTTGIVIFADLDLAPEEASLDFAHEPLPELSRPNTVGLWVGLHGESILEAGMHHLEAQFDFEGLRTALKSEAEIETMKPFSDFPFLRQAFTSGERWTVDRGRADRLLESRVDRRRATRAFFGGGGYWQPPGEFAAERGVQGIQPAGRERDHRGDRPASSPSLELTRDGSACAAICREAAWRPALRAHPAPAAPEQMRRRGGAPRYAIMSSFQPELDQDVATLDQERASWEPPGGVTHHSGIILDPQLDFFAPPPPEIGDVASAASTLKTTKRPMPFVSRLLLCGLFASIGVAVLRLFEIKEPVLDVLLAVVLGGLTWYFTRFRHECSYVGKLGTARLFCKAKRSQVHRSEVFLFNDAAELRTSQTRHYTHGVYSGTNYTHTWTDAEGRKRYKLTGTYHGEKSPPKPQSPFHFAQAAEIWWSNFLLDRALEELNTTGAIRFNIGRNDWVAIGTGFIDLHMDGKDARCAREEIAGVSLNGGIFEIKRTDAKIGWFSKTGVFSFGYGQMANSRLFILALDKLLGFRFG